MFWDYLRARLSLVIGFMVGVLVFILLLLYSDNFWVLIGFLPLYTILLRSFVKRVSIKTMHDLERSLYKELKVLDYASKYEYLAHNGVKFDERWTVTKYHNAILGNIFLGKTKKARNLIEFLEDSYGDFYGRNAVFKYMFEVLKTLHAMFFETPHEFNTRKKTMLKTFESLPENVRKQIKANEESFHNWIQWIDKHIVSKSSDKVDNLLKTVREMPKLNAAGAYFLLKKKDPALKDEKLDGYLRNAFIADETLND